MKPKKNHAELADEAQKENFSLTGVLAPTFLDIAEIYLRRVGKPMSAREIVALATTDGMLRTKGLTPWQTMKSKLSTDILTRGEKSRFKRVFEGVFALRDDSAAEYQAPRFVKGKLEEDIAVIPASELGQLINGPGLWMMPIDRHQLTSLSHPMLRREAEETYEVIQLISVFVVTYQGRFLTHLRSARLPEKRLHGEYSMMLGGHLAIEDFAQLTLDLFSTDEDLADCTYILRELSEELVLKTSPIVEPRGYIYDISRDVSKQHLGMIYLVTLPELSFEIGERGFLMNAKMETIDQIKSRREDFENWSWLIMDNIEKLKGQS